MEITISEFYSNSNVKDCPKEKRPEYAFIGRSNVGKSSLINMILNKKIAYTSSKPGKTQLINHILINDSWCLVDLPGYGYAKISKIKRSQIKKMTKNYFTQRGLQLATVFVLIDIRIPTQQIDLDWMEWLVKNNIYFIRVFTKCDNMKKEQILKTIQEYDLNMNKNHWETIPESIVTSSTKMIGKKDILKNIQKINNLFNNI
ncbi:MAG: YihA family ribosome biogenesis GTP-binding protein [Flavobacteriales bacterium]|nr:YihA family ribosome biogenesis GTP-binding protein [Flavobacteriales bacterium]